MNALTRSRAPVALALALLGCSRSPDLRAPREGDGTDGGVTDAGASDDAGGAACTVTASTALCVSNRVVTVQDSADTREVYWTAPAGERPASGAPAVILYQGTGVGPDLTWNVPIGVTTAFGGYYQVALIAELRDAGFVVLQPAADGAAWDTNLGAYDASPDAAFIPALLAEIAGGTFGSVDMARLYATGISSGGYMTSRMAVSYPGKFRALAIASGAYATCAGSFCTTPGTLPADHPPTLFLHGGMDTIVPIGTAQTYQRELAAQGVDTKFVEDPNAGHQWLSTAPADVTGWFVAHP